MSAVAEPVLSAPPSGRTYVARRSELLLILERDRRRVNQETGETVETIQGKRLQFTDGQLFVPEKGSVRGARGEKIPAQDVIVHLEGRGEPGDEDYVEPHDMFGNREEGFVRLPKIAPALSEDEAQAVVDLAIAGDLEGLEALHAAEQDGWARADMLELIGSTLDKVRAVQAA